MIGLIDYLRGSEYITYEFLCILHKWEILKSKQLKDVLPQNSTPVTYLNHLQSVLPALR